MLFNALIICISSIYVGLDVGSYFTKASIVENSRGPSALLNGKQSPNTPSFIAFRSRQNFNWKSNKPLSPDEIGQLHLVFGEPALRTMETRPWMGSGFFPLLCNLHNDSANSYTNPFGFNSSAARVQYEDLLILYLKSYLDSIINNTSQIQDICLVFPATFTNPQRYVFEFALQNIGIKQIHSIDDVEAISNVYAIEHSEKFQKKPKTVLFIDIGGLSIKSYSVRFYIDQKQKAPKALRLSYSINRKQGGAYLTNQIVEHLQNELQIKKVNEAEYRRLFRAAEKMKIELMTQTSSMAIADDINGLDRQVTLNQSQLECLSNDLINDIYEIFKEATKNIEYDDIEIIGGASHNSLLIKNLEKKLKKKVHQSLDPESSHSIGAGYSLSFRHNDQYVPLSIKEENSIYTIQCTTLNGTFSVCNKSHKCLDTLILPPDSQLAMFAYSDDEIQSGQVVTAFGFYLDYIKEGEIQIKLKHSPLRVHSAHSCVNKQCKENHFETIEPPKKFSQVYALYNNPELRLKRLNQTKNELILFTSQVLHEVEKNQSFRYFTNHSQRLEIIRCAEAQRKWLIANKDLVTEPINFTLRLNELKKLVYPVYRRINENFTLYFELEKLFQTIANGKNGLNVFWPANRTYVDQNIIKKFEVLLTEAENFLNETVEMMVNSPGWKSFPVQAKKVKEINEDLDLKYNEIQLARPPPSPDNPDQKINLPEDFYQNYQKGYQNEKHIESYDEFLESKKDPYSIDDL